MPRPKWGAAAEAGKPRVQLAPRSAVAERTEKEESAVAEKEKEHKKEKKHKEKQEKEESAVAEKDKKKKKHGKEDKKGRKDEEKEKSAVAEKRRKHREHKEPQEAPKAQKQEAQKAQKQALKEEPKQALKEEPKQALKEEPKKEAKEQKRLPKEAAKEAAREAPKKRTASTPPQKREPKAVRAGDLLREPAVAGTRTRKGRPDSDGSASDSYTYTYSNSEGEPAAAAAAPSGARGAEKRAGGQPQKEPKTKPKESPRTKPKEEPQEGPKPAAPASEEAAVAAASPPPDRDRQRSSSKSRASSDRSEDEDARAATVGRCTAAHKQAAAVGVPAPPQAVQPEPRQQWGAYHQHWGAYQDHWRAYHQHWGAYHQQYHQQWHASQGSAQQSSAVAEGSDARSEFGVGQAQCVYVDVAEEANLPEIASDLRLQGPHVLLVRCSAVEQRRELQRLLEEPRIAAGEQGKPEVQFRCDSQGSVLLAGRDGFVSEVSVVQFLRMERVGEITIGEFALATSVQHMASIKVAVVSLTPSDRGTVDSELAERWTKIVDSMARKTVRFVAGQFADKLDHFLVSTRTSLQATACATVHFHAHAESCETTAMFILGPVGNVKERLEGGGYTITRGDGEVASKVESLIDHAQAMVGQDTYVGAVGQDRSRGWPAIQHVKERKPQHVSEHTRKIVIFFGSTASRRSGKKLHERADSREERADKWYAKTGKQQCWRR